MDPAGRTVLGRRGYVVVLVFFALGVCVLFWSWIEAQARAVVVISSVLEVPLLTPAVETITGEPRIEETVVAGNPASIFVPEGEEPYPALVFVNGAVPQGRKLPEVRRLAEALARTGYLVVIPDLPGLREGEISPQTASGTVESARAVAQREDARGGRVALIGVSTGATLALLAAEDPALEGRVSVVAGVAPYADIKTVLNVATTGHYRFEGSMKPYDAEPLLSYIVARSVITTLPSGADRDNLLAELDGAERRGLHPLEDLRKRRADDLGPKARSVLALLSNRDPARFDRLYGGLPQGVREDLKQLSPLAGAGRIEAPVELASGPQDKYFPLSESRALGLIAPEFRLSVTGALDHAEVGFSADEIPDFVRLDAFVVRVLHEARRGA